MESVLIGQPEKEIPKISYAVTGCGNTFGSFDTSVDSNTQSTICANAVSCLNVGENTNVIANGADCVSDEPDTTT